MALGLLVVPSAMPKRRRFDALEVALTAILTLAIGLAVQAAFRSRGERTYLSVLDYMTAESRGLRAKFGPDSNTRYEEEWVIRDFFQNKQGGVFLDVGANDYRRESNTYYLETQLGWSGIAVEPQREFEEGYTKYRPRTRFRAFFASDKSNEQAKLYVQRGNSLVTSSDRSFTEREGRNITEMTAPTITLNDLLDAEHIAHIDFMSVDVELHEPQVLAGFDVERFSPALVCIEAHPEVRQQILDYFTRRNYVVAGKYLRADIENLYFMPLPRATPGAS